MDLLQRSVAEYEKEFEMLEKYQITDPQDPDFGGYYNKDFGVVAQNCGSAAAKPMTLYFCPQSRYYKDPRALACADGLVQHLLNHLHPDGTMDYYSCNFHSAPDTAFASAFSASIIACKSSLTLRSELVAGEEKGVLLLSASFSR